MLITMVLNKLFIKGRIGVLHLSMRAIYLYLNALRESSIWSTNSKEEQQQKEITIKVTFNSKKEATQLECNLLSAIIRLIVRRSELMIPDWPESIVVKMKQE